MESPEIEDSSIDDKVVKVTNAEWVKTEFYFRVPPDKNYTVNILAERETGNGSLQIRNLVVKERVS